MSDVLEILKRGGSGLDALLRAVLLDSENKVPAERLRIVGALSDGAVIESGSNSNGYWLKLADGTLVCWNQVSEQGVALSPSVRFWKAMTLPHVITSNYFMCGMALHSASAVWCGQFYVHGDTQVEVDIFTQKQTDVGTLTCGYMVVARP